MSGDTYNYQFNFFGDGGFKASDLVPSWLSSSNAMALSDQPSADEILTLPSPPSYSEEEQSALLAAVLMNPQLAMAAFGIGMYATQKFINLGLSGAGKLTEAAVNYSRYNVTNENTQPQEEAGWFKALTVGTVKAVVKGGTWIAGKTIKGGLMVAGGMGLSQVFASDSVKQAATHTLYPWMQRFPKLAEWVMQFQNNADMHTGIIEQYANVTDVSELSGHFKDQAAQLWTYYNEEAAQFVMENADSLYSWAAKHASHCYEHPAESAYSALQTGVTQIAKPALGLLHLFTKVGLEGTLGKLPAVAGVEIGQALASDNAAYVVDAVAAGVLMYYGTKAAMNRFSGPAVNNETSVNITVAGQQNNSANNSSVSPSP